MSSRQIAKWNRRYADRGEGRLDPPSAPLPDAVDGVTPGRALDLACGAGRHAVWLARRGWEVEAVDGSSTAIERLAAHAARAGCGDRIVPIVADLETEPPAFTIPPDRYDLVVDCYFLHRPLFEAVRRGVRPGGLFVAAIHLPGDGSAAGSGHRYLLEPGELDRLVDGWGWTILHCYERPGHHAGHDLGVAEIVARRP